MGAAGDAPPPHEARSATEEEHAHRRAALREHLGHVEEALRQWHRRENALRRGTPPQDAPPRPPLTRQTLEELRAILLEELTHLEEPP